MCVHGAMKGTELRREETATNVKCNPGNPVATAAFSASIAICNGSTDSRALVLKPRSRFFYSQRPSSALIKICKQYLEFS